MIGLLNQIFQLNAPLKVGFFNCLILLGRKCLRGLLHLLAALAADEG